MIDVVRDGSLDAIALGRGLGGFFRSAGTVPSLMVRRASRAAARAMSTEISGNIPSDSFLVLPPNR
jgi:hypothetical protein